MANISIYQDRRYVRKDGTSPMKLLLSHKGQTVLIPIDIALLPEHWDRGAGKVVGHPKRIILNSSIARERMHLEGFVFELKDRGELSTMKASEVLRRYKHFRKTGEIEMPDSDCRLKFRDVYMDFANKKKESTKELYLSTLSRIYAYCPNAADLHFEDIDLKWLQDFEAFLALTSKSANARSIHLRNIRAVFNYALDLDLTTCYPFRRFKIKTQPTRKRSMTIDDLRKLINCPVDGYAEPYRDMFVLIFLLIGINVVDLYGLREITPEGRVEFARAKTGRLYSIKVEPEAAAIIEKYKGSSRLLFMADRWDDHRNFRKQLNKALQRIGAPRTGLGGKKDVEKSMFPELTSYWARHTWATIAASLDIPKETIAAALGHGGNTVTDIYIDFDQRKVDAANRKVIDWVFYGKA